MAVSIKSLQNDRKNTGTNALILPSLSSPTSWDLWKVSNGVLTPIGQRDPSQINRRRKGSILALPTTDVFCVSLWLNETDQAKFPSMISLQLEGRGFKLSEGSRAFDWSPVTFENGKALVMVGILPNKLLPALLAANFDWFDAAVRFREYTEDSLTIWQEQGRLCLAFTRGKQLVHFQALTENVLNPSTIRDIACIVTSLQMQEVLKNLKSIVLWFKTDPEGSKSLGTALSVNINSASPPKPRLPDRDWTLQLAGTAESKKFHHRLQWRDRTLKCISLAYGLALLFILGHLLITLHLISSINSWQQENKLNLETIHQDISTWEFLTPLVETKDYPLETLLHCATSLSPAGTHLTLYEQVDGNITIKAESQNIRLADAFLEKLTHEPALSDYHWVRPQPQVLPNDLAQFEINGTREPTKY